MTPMGTPWHPTGGTVMFYDAASIRFPCFDKDRVGAGEPSEHEPRDHQARPTHEQSNAPGNPRQPQPDDPQTDFDFDSPNGKRPNDLANPSARELRRESRGSEQN
ncbi:hypothetical protein HWX16_14570 [Ochrobactrum intermedium]|nr:hypothetical protein F9K77_19410 [Ochrobactrum sp. LMG 5442]NVM41551.1 hypothetical protein [Brucella intermedia]